MLLLFSDDPKGRKKSLRNEEECIRSAREEAMWFERETGKK